jgi:hypothetical protein
LECILPPLLKVVTIVWREKRLTAGTSVIIVHREAIQLEMEDRAPTVIWELIGSRVLVSLLVFCAVIAHPDMEWTFCVRGK